MRDIILTFAILFIVSLGKASTMDASLNADSLNNVEIKQAIFHIKPSSYLVQTGGSIGLIAVGAGWDYGKKKQWATELLLGYVPKYDTDRVKLTLSIRQLYSPWKIPINTSFSYSPLRTGLYLSTTLGKQFWYSAPEKYPKDYYTFSTKLRANIFLGQSFEWNMPKNPKILRKLAFYYDVHVSDLMLISRIQNKSLSGFNFMGLALGLKLHL